MRKHPLGKALLLLLMACLCALALCSCSMLDRIFGRDDPDETTTSTTPTPDHTHSYTVSVVEPTCTEEGYTLHTCACGDTFRDNITQAEHTLSYVGAQASTCSEAGRKEHWHCDRCGKNFGDENATAEMADVLIPAGHSFGAWVTVKEADCTAEGSEQRTCSVCRTAEVRPIAPIGHALSHVQAQASTCSEAGHTEHWHCDRCGKNFSDENGTAEMASVTLPPTAHTFGAWVTVKEADCTTDGSEQRTCSVCQATETRTIDATGHTYASGWSYNKTEHWHAATCEHADQTDEKAPHSFDSNDQCTVCGYENAEATPDEYFIFTLLADDTYKIEAKDTDDLPAKIILPGTYNGKPVTSIGEYAFWNCSTLTSITIPDGVTAIGECAFMHCSSLTTLTIPDSVISIGMGAFAGCMPKSVTIPDSVISIGDLAFYYCTSLASVTIPGSVRNIGYGVFAYCSSLKIIIVDESNAFYKSVNGDLYTKDGSALIQYAMGKTATAFNIPIGVTSIGMGAFTGCMLESITIPDGVTSIGNSAFADCSSLTSITIPDGVTSIGAYAFENCSSLASVTIPGNVTSISDYAFAGCSSLTSVTIPDGVTSIGMGAFRDCSSLASITIPDSVTSIGFEAFYGCSSLTSITIPDSVTSIGQSAFSDTAYYNDENNWEDGVLYIGKHLIEVNSDLSGAYAIKNGTCTIASGAFEGCFSLTSITIPNSVTSIGTGAFARCSSLTSVTIPGSVASIGWIVFDDCTSLISITVEESNECYKSINGDLYSKDGKTLMQYAIGKTATSFDIPVGVTTIGDYAFAQCSSLTSVTIPSGVTSIGDFAFSGCSSLTSITVPDSVTTLGAYAFSWTAYYNDENNWKDGVLYIGKHLIKVNTAFSGAFEIKDGTLTIVGGAFEDCSLLTSITIPDSITKIGEEAFAWCSSLTSIIIPDSVTTIGTCAFLGCSSLASATFENTAWAVSTSSDMSDSISVDVSDPAAAATYLKTTYCYCYWKGI